MRRAQRWPRRCAASTARRASSRRVDVELLGLEVRRPVDSASDPRGSDPASDCAKTGHSRSVTCLGGQHVQKGSHNELSVGLTSVVGGEGAEKKYRSTPLAPCAALF